MYIFFKFIIKCDIINTIDKFFDDDPNNPEEHNSMKTLNMIFTESNCSSGEEKISSGFIALLTLLNSIDNNDHLKGDQLVEYAILWLSYKLNQKKENGTNILSDFLTGHIKKNSCYDKHIATSSGNGNKIYMEVIDKKIESIDIDIKDISNFYDAFKSLCNMYSELNENKNQCKKCFESAGEFFEKCEKVKNAFDINKGRSYLQLWSSLSNDYIMFKQLYNIDT
ncbi:putative yir4 protein, partial [Plasmodium yoelii yoelii]